MEAKPVLTLFALRQSDSEVGITLVRGSSADAVI